MRVLVVPLLLLAAVAGAYESKCFYVLDVPCHPGPESAQNRWQGGLDEHRQIWELSRSRAGIPFAASSPMGLRVYTSGATVDTPNGPVPSMQPVDFRQAKKAVDHPGPATPGEFAQLPDFSYSLWDWVLGHETCPLDSSIDATTCHTFETHMGPANSSHFPPQSQEFYRHYHGLALARARECETFAQRLGEARGRFLTYLQACEREALVLEAIGHHFLQDAWSMGHMWERWGSPEPADILANLNGARVLGAVSGLIHGARGALQGVIPGADVSDPMCAPAIDVGWRRPAPGSPVFPAVGDDYWALVEPEYPRQLLELLLCTTAGVREVYDQISTPALGAPTGLAIPVNVADTCFSQRATNRAIARGAQLEFAIPATGGYQVLPLADLGVFVLPGVVEQPDALKVTAEQRLDVVRVAFHVRSMALADPDGVQLASGGMPALFGFSRNRAYASRQPIASYVDPPLPWPGSGGDPRAVALARAFHRGHAPDWCDQMSLDYLRGLKAHVQSAAGSGVPDELAAATEVCGEFVRRHVRGRDADGNAVTDAPLCSLAASAPDAVAVVEVATAAAAPTDESLAARWCGCGNRTLDAGEECDESSQGGDAACPGGCRPPNHTTEVGGVVAFDDCSCGEVCDDDEDNDGDGDVDCADEDDCRDDPACSEIVDLGRGSVGEVNDAGQVAGLFFLDDGSNHAFLWDDGSLQDLGTHPLATVPNPPPGPHSSGRGLNDLGVVVGTACCFPPLGEHAMTYAAGTWTDIHAGNQVSYARDVNNAGVVVGYADGNPAPGLVTTVPARWVGGVIGLLPMPSGHTRGEAMAVNDAGRVVGWSGPAFDSHAQVWDDGVLSSIPPTDRDGAALAVNSLGVVVGWQNNPSGQRRPVRWTGGAGGWSATELPVLPGRTFGEAHGISTLGRIVGWVSGSGVQRAVRWDGDVPTDMTAELPPGSGWRVLVTAEGVSPDGRWVIGRGERETDNPGFQRMYALQVPAP